MIKITKMTDDEVAEMFLGAELLQALLNRTTKTIFSELQILVDKNQFNTAKSYIRALAIDMIGKCLTFPGIEIQGEADYISKWIKSRYQIDLEMRVNNADK